MAASKHAAPATRRGTLLLVTALALVGAEHAVRADGMAFTPPVAGKIEDVEVGPQRGLVWQRPDALSVWIEVLLLPLGSGGLHRWRLE